MSDEQKTEPTQGERLETKLDDLGERFSKDVTDAVDPIKAENEELKARMTALEDANRQMIARGPDSKDKRPEPISIARLAQGIIRGKVDGYEGEAIAETRALGIGSDAAGGYIVSPAFMADQYIDLYRANVVAIAAGARVLSGLTGSPVLIPKLGSGSTAYWTAENAAITASDQGLENVTMTPHKCSGLTKISNELLRMSTPAAEQIIRDDLAATIGRKVDLAVLKGSGASGEPLGLANTSGINTTTQNATTTLAHCSAMETALATDDALHGKLAFVMHPRTWGTLSALLAAAGADYGARWENGVGMKVIGYPVHLSTQLSIVIATDESEMFLNNWDDVLIGEWGGIEFMASQHADTAFAADQTWIRATHLVDVGVREAESVCYCLDVRA